MLLRSRVLRENGKYLPKQVQITLIMNNNKWNQPLKLYTFNVINNAVPPQSFVMRKHYFNNPDTGFFKTVKRKVTPKNPMTGKTLIF